MRLFSRASKTSKIIGIALAAIHFFISWWVVFEVAQSSHDAQRDIIWVSFWPFDFPLSLLHIGALMYLPQFDVEMLPDGISDFQNFLVPTFVYGVFGPLWYFAIPVVISHAFNVLKTKFDFRGLKI